MNKYYFLKIRCLEDGKKEWVHYNRTMKGNSITEILEELNKNRDDLYVIDFYSEITKEEFEKDNGWS